MVFGRLRLTDNAARSRLTLIVLRLHLNLGQDLLLGGSALEVHTRHGLVGLVQQELNQGGVDGDRPQPCHFVWLHSLVENHSWVALVLDAVLNDVGPAALVGYFGVVEEGPL